MMTDFTMVSAMLYTLAAGLVVMTVLKLMTCCADHYSDGERIGLGMMAGGMTMVIASRFLPLIATQLRNDLSPFNVWPGIIAAVGIYVFIQCDAKRRTKMEKLLDLTTLRSIRD